MASPTYQFSVQQTADGSTLYLNDITGSYSGSNLGGYGAPNTPRTDLALIMMAKYKGIAGDTRLSVSVYDPEVVTQWVIPGLTLDGHYEMKIYQVPRSSTEGTPVAGLFRWDFGTNLLERYTGSVWVTSPVTSVNQYLELETYDRPHSTVDYPVLYKMWIALNNLNKLSITGCKTETRSDIQKAIMDTTNMINGVIALFAEGNYQQAQDNIEKYQSRVDHLIALS